MTLTIPLVYRVLYVIGGGIIFWTPSLVVHGIKSHTFSGINVLILTVLLPMITVGAFNIIWIFQHERINRSSLAHLIVFGIWLFGPLFMYVGWYSIGNGSDQLTLGNVIASIILFPVFTFMMSGYDGTLFAVLLASLLLILISKARP